MYNLIQVLIQQMTELTHFSEAIGSSDENGDLREFVKMFQILFHGQPEVERGVTVNNQLLVENLKTKSLVALLRIEDHINFLELSPETIKISNELIKCVKKHTAVIKMSKRNKENKNKSHKNLSSV